MKTLENQILVIFGASGDLTKRKLIPALFELYKQNSLPEKFAVLGASRSQMNDEEFRKKISEFLSNSKEVKEFSKKQEEFKPYALAAFLLLIVGILLKVSVFRNIP